MADKVDEKIENEVCAKKKDVVDSPVKDKKEPEEKPEKENGDVHENAKDKEEVNAKESEDVVCPVKRKSGGGDVAEEKAADDVTPEKKAKLDEAPADAESNGETEVAA